MIEWVNEQQVGGNVVEKCQWKNCEGKVFQIQKIGQMWKSYDERREESTWNIDIFCWRNFGTKWMKYFWNHPDANILWIASRSNVSVVLSLESVNRIVAPNFWYHPIAGLFELVMNRMTASSSFAILITCLMSANPSPRLRNNFFTYKLCIVKNRPWSNVNVLLYMIHPIHLS